MIGNSKWGLLLTNENFLNGDQHQRSRAKHKHTTISQCKSSLFISQIVVSIIQQVVCLSVIYCISVFFYKVADAKADIKANLRN